MPLSDTITPPHRGLWSGLSSQDADPDLGVLGVPFDNATSYRKGAALAPAKIRAITPHIAPVTEEGLRLAGLRVHDYGDVPIDLNWDRYFAAVQAEAIKVLQFPFALFVGGDHSVTIPLVSAFGDTANGRIGYVQFDSHPDLMNEFNGHRWSHACTARRVLELPAIEPRHVAFIGIRSWLHDELDYLADHPEVKVHTARGLHRRGIQAIAEDIVRQFEDLDAIYLSLDIDILDPAFAPGTGTPEAGGLSTRDLLELLRVIFTNLPVQALDIVEVAPPLDSADITSMAAIKVIYEVFGWLAARDREGARLPRKSAHSQSD